MSKDIKISANGKLIGAIQDVQWSYERTAPSHNSFTCNRIRFDKLQLKEAFDGFPNSENQAGPLQIMLESDDKIIHIHNAWITSSSYSYGTADWIIADRVEMQAEDITSISKPIMCKYCTTRPNHVAHDYVVSYVISNNDKDSILRLLGAIPKVAISSGKVREMLEIIKGHFPERYNELEGLLTLL